MREINMIFKIMLRTIKNLFKIMEVFKMADYFNPDAPKSGGSWLAHTYNNVPATQTFHQVGYTQNPFYTGNDPSRRTMMNNPGYQFQPQQTTPAAPAQIKPFSTYPAAPSVPTLGQFAAQQTQAQPAAPWAATPTNPQPFTPITAQPTGNMFGYNYETPKLIPFDTSNALNSWNKKAGSWDYTPNTSVQMPVINWSAYTNPAGSNGYQIPTSQCGIQPMYPTGYNTTPINENWDGICDTNFKQQF